MPQQIRKDLEPFFRLDRKLTVELDATEEAVIRMKGRLSEPVDTRKLHEAPHDAARAVVAANRQLFGGIDEKVELADGRSATDSTGMTHVLLEQKHGDAAVLGGAISVHFKADGTLHLLESSLERHIDAPREPRLQADQAQRIALLDAGAEAVLVDRPKPKLIVVSAEYLKLPAGGRKFHLCWEIAINQPRKKQPAAWIYFIDAVEGSVLLCYSALVAGSGTGYHSGAGSVNTEPSAGQFVAVDEVTSAGWPLHPAIQTRDWSTTDLAADDNDVWAEPEAAELHEKPEVDIHRYLGYALTYFYLHHGHIGWDHAGGNAVGYAHYGDPNNAYWDELGNTILVGDGNMASAGSPYTPFCSFDVLVHEFTHGVNHGFGIVSTYIDETGAINEGIADSFAAFASLDYPAEDSSPWVNGERISVGVHPRSLADPARDAAGIVQYDATSDTTRINSVIKGFYPDHYSIRYTGPHDKWHDFGGVHCNCTIIGHAIYLMVNGGVHRLSGIAVTAIGAVPVEKMLYYTISTPGLLNATSQFADFRKSMLFACETLYPDNLDYLVTVKNAFKAVGVGPDLYLRDAPGETGVEPGIVSCMSPDIINRRTKADAAMLAQIADTTNAWLCETIALNQDNFVYFRIFNGGSDLCGGTFRLFISPASSFPNPASWTEVGTYPFPSISASAYWTATAPNECITLPAAVVNDLGEGHFCFIGVIESDQDPAPDRMQIHNLADFYDFISKSNNYAWRNCDIENIVAPPAQPVLIEKRFVMNGMGAIAQAMDLEVDTSNLPPGAVVQLLLPRTLASNVRFADVRRKQERSGRPHIGQIPAAIPAIEQKFTARSAADFFTRTEEMFFTHGMLDRLDVAALRPLKMEARRITRVTGLHLDGRQPVPVNFVVKLPPGHGRRSFYLAFRQIHKGNAIGQMNYLFRLR